MVVGARLSCCLAVLCAALLLVSSVDGLIQNLRVKNDRRRHYYVDGFGFQGGGFLLVNISKIEFNPPNDVPEEMGFVLKRSDYPYSRYSEEDFETSPNQCLLTEELGPYDDRFDLADGEFRKTIPAEGGGFYSLIFASCDKSSIHISFDLHMVAYNPGPNYLSIGLSPLPTIFAALFVVYLALNFVWCSYLRPAQGKKIFIIHYLMAILLILKTLAVFFHSIELHYLKFTGHAGFGGFLYYSVSFVEGIAMFVVVTLIGTGWAFVKPLLTDREKHVLLIVIPLQVIDNIALIIVEESAPGAPSWMTWLDIFRIVDIICCIAVLLPIVWSIKHLRDAAQGDGKALRSLEKLKMFRQFYLVVVSYIYFTRIIIYLLEATLPYDMTWVSPTITELATLTFFCWTGYLFRPLETNPYIKAQTEEQAAIEMADLVADGEI